MTPSARFYGPSWPKASVGLAAFSAGFRSLVRGVWWFGSGSCGCGCFGAWCLRGDMVGTAACGGTCRFAFACFCMLSWALTTGELQPNMAIQYPAGSYHSVLPGGSQELATDQKRS